MPGTARTKIGLGTVQFGLAYGISNRAGKTPAEETASILAAAREAGVRALDTAPAYGESEAVLGRCLGDPHPFDIVTKTAHGEAPYRASDRASVEGAFRESLRKLGQARVHGLLVHRVEDLLGPDGASLYDCLKGLRDEGLTARIGASVYTPEQVEELAGKYALDLIQLPFNALDQRMRARGILRGLKRAGAEIHARSAFLQGLLLMRPEELGAHFAPLLPHLRGYRAYLDERGLSPVQGALGFALGVEEIDAVICGVNTLAQFRELLSSSRPLPPEGFARFGIDDARFLDPSRWVSG